MNGNYRTVVELKNGCHKIVLLSYSQVAHVVSEVRKFKAVKTLFREIRKISLNGDTLVMNDIKSWKFINVRTGQELLTI